MKAAESCAKEALKINTGAESCGMEGLEETCDGRQMTIPEQNNWLKAEFDRHRDPEKSLEEFRRGYLYRTRSKN